MSNADDPKKKPPQSTMAWTPEDLEAAAAGVGSESAEGARTSDAAQAPQSASANPRYRAA